MLDAVEFAPALMVNLGVSGPSINLEGRGLPPGVAVSAASLLNVEADAPTAPNDNAAASEVLFFIKSLRLSFIIQLNWGA